MNKYHLPHIHCMHLSISWKTKKEKAYPFMTHLENKSGIYNKKWINWLITNSGHGNNGKIEWGDVTLPEVNLSEMGIAIVTHFQASNPSVSLLGGRHGCGQIIKEAGSRMCAVKFHNKKLGNSCEKVVDHIFLQLLKKLCHSACSAQTYPQQVPHTLFSSRSLQCN